MAKKRQRGRVLPKRVPPDFKEKRDFFRKLWASVTSEEIEKYRRKREEEAFPDAHPSS